MKITLKKLRNFALILTLAVVSTGIGYRLGEQNVTLSVTDDNKIVVNTQTPEDRDIDFSLFWEVWSRLERSYVDKSKLDPQKMVWGAISGMVSSLGDPYTVFLPPKENQEFKDDLGGSLEGIGAQLGLKDDRIVVIAPLKDTPAERAGIRAGDIILKVNDEETFGWTVPEAVTKIRGPRGSTVNLTVYHEGASDESKIAIVRDEIIIPYVDLDVVQSSKSASLIAHIKLLRFGDQTNSQWDSTISEIVSNEDIEGIILDVRNNPGGYLQSAIYIANEFIRQGIIVQQENYDNTRETYSVTRAGNLYEIPLVVLINKGSASAAEILAGALRDHDRAILIGETSFGKGSIQTPEDLPGGSAVHITTARWLLPSGDWINEKGVSPDLEVKNDPKDIAGDLQLERALDEVVNLKVAQYAY